MSSPSSLIVERARDWTGVSTFPPDLETDFRADYFERSLKPVRIGLLLAAALFAAFGALDAWMMPSTLRLVWAVRYLLVVPVMLAAFVFTYSPRFERVWRPILVAMALLGGGAIIFMVAVASGTTALLYYAGLLLAFPWVHGLARLGFREASLVTWSLTVGYEAVAIIVKETPTPLLASNTFFLVSANVIAMFVSFHQEELARRGFLQRRLLEQRKQEAEATMRRLREAQDRLTRIEQQSPYALENLPAWADIIAADIRRAIEASEVRVWELDEGELRPVTAGRSSRPPIAALNASALVTLEGGDTVFRVAGMTGEVYGAVVVSGASGWDDDAQRLVTSFVRHLGGVFEIRRMRRALVSAAERREAVRRRMAERGERPLLLCPACGRCYDDQVERCHDDGARLTQRLVPLRIDSRYRILRLLGRGGMGQVFEAHDEALTRPVAVKVLRADRGLTPELRAQLYNEARAAARVHHRGVVEIFDVGDLEDGSAFLVMELVSGMSLASVLEAHGPGTPRQVAALLRQTAAALGAAHRAGIVHRDLKPQNIFLVPSDDGFGIKVLDFGIARSVDIDATLSGGGMLVGTPAYMSPEQVRGTRVDARSDLYSLAVLTYEALTGTRPAAHGSVAATLLAVLSESLPAPSTLIGGLAPQVDAAFAHALAKNPDHRPSDVEAWALPLATVLEPAPAEKPGWPTMPPAEP